MADDTVGKLASKIVGMFFEGESDDIPKVESLLREAIKQAEAFSYIKGQIDGKDREYGKWFKHGVDDGLISAAKIARKSEWHKAGEEIASAIEAFGEGDRKMSDAKILDMVQFVEVTQIAGSYEEPVVVKLLPRRKGNKIIVTITEFEKPRGTDDANQVGSD